MKKKEKLTLSELRKAEKKEKKAVVINSKTTIFVDKDIPDHVARENWREKQGFAQSVGGKVKNMRHLNNGLNFKDD